MRLAPLPLQPPPRTAPAGVSRSAGGSLSARATVGGSHSGGGTTSLPGGGNLGASTWRALTSRNTAPTSFAPHNSLAAAYDARQQLRSRLLKQQPDRGGGNPLLRVREIHSSAHPRSRTSMYGPFNLKIDAAASASHRDPAAVSHATAAANAGASAAANAAEEQDCLRSPPYKQARAPMRFGKGGKTSFGDKLAAVLAADGPLGGGGDDGPIGRNRRQKFRRPDGFSPKLTRAMLRQLLQDTNMTRTELYRLYNRFKALCVLSGTPGHISKTQFKDGVSSLAFEDDVFVDRVFNLLDENNSGTVEWTEFVNAVNALESGTPYDKLVFCFRVYDRDNSNTIERQELLEMFSSMLLSSGRSASEASNAAPPTPALQELIEDFVDTIYDSFDLNGSSSLEFEEVHAAVQRKGAAITDVWEIFGRTLVPRGA